MLSPNTGWRVRAGDTMTDDLLSALNNHGINDPLPGDVREALRQLGISNVSRDQLEQLCGLARVPPAFVQNRCYASRGWDADVRDACARHGITYQGFSLLTANVRELQRPEFWRIVDRVGKTPAQVVFRFAQRAGILPLTGTTDPDHMREDHGVYDFDLSEDDVRSIENIALVR